MANGTARAGALLPPPGSEMSKLTGAAFSEANALAGASDMTLNGFAVAATLKAATPIGVTVIADDETVTVNSELQRLLRVPRFAPRVTPSQVCPRLYCTGPVAGLRHPAKRIPACMRAQRSVAHSQRLYQVRLAIADMVNVGDDLWPPRSPQPDAMGRFVSITLRVPKVLRRGLRGRGVALFQVRRQRPSGARVHGGGPRAAVLPVRTVRPCLRGMPGAALLSVPSAGAHRPGLPQ